MTLGSQLKPSDQVTGMDSRYHRFAALLLIIVSAFYVVHLEHYGNYIIDDAGISYTYARNLADGHGLVFNIGGEKVEGYSNPLWVFLLAGFIKLRLFDPILTPKILSALLTITSFFFIFRFFISMRSGWSSLIIAFLVSLTIAANASLTVWSGSGLENALYNFLIFYGLYRLHRETTGGSRYAIAGFIFFLIAISRPDGIVYAAAGLICLILPGTTRQWRIITINGVVFLICFGLYHLWHYYYFMEILPNTYYAKQLFVPFRYRILDFEWRGWAYIGQCLNDYRLYWLLPPVVAGLWSKPKKMIFPLAMTIASLALVIVSGGDWMMQYRLLHPFIMLIMVSAGLGLLLAWNKSRRYPIYRWILLVISIAALAVINHSNLAQIRAIDRYKTVDFSGVKRTHHAFISALADTLMVPHPTVFTADLGATGYYEGLTVYDAGLLTDYHLARYRYKDFFGDYLFDERYPDFLGHQGGSVARLTHLWKNPDLHNLYAIFNEGEVNVDRYGPGIIDGRYIRKDIFLKNRLPLYAQSSRRLFSNGLTLAGYELPPAADSAADRVSLAVYWNSPTAAEDSAVVSLVLLNSRGEVQLDYQFYPGYQWHRPDRWIDDELVCQNLFIPRACFHGDSSIVVALADSTDRPYVLGTIVFDQYHFERHLSAVIDSSLSITENIRRSLRETAFYLRRLNRDFWDSPRGSRLVSEYVDLYLGEYHEPPSPDAADSLLAIVEILKRLDPANRDLADYGFTLHEYFRQCASDCLENEWWRYPQAFACYLKALRTYAAVPELRKEIEAIRPWVHYIRRHPELKRQYPDHLPLDALLDIYREFLRGSPVQKRYFQDLLVNRLITDQQVREEFTSLSIMDRMHLHQLGFVDNPVSTCYLNEPPQATFGGNTLEMAECRLRSIDSGRYLFEAVFIPHYLPDRIYALCLNITGESLDVLPERYRFRGTAPLSFRTIPELCDLPDNSPTYVYQIIEPAYTPIQYEVTVYAPGGPPWYPLPNDTDGENLIPVSTARDNANHF